MQETIETVCMKGGTSATTDTKNGCTSTDLIGIITISMNIMRMIMSWGEDDDNNEDDRDDDDEEEDEDESGCQR